jgi:tetratricopeptide (TPR) repeat protein
LFLIQSEVAATIAGFVRANTEPSNSSKAHVPSRPRFNAATYELMLECRHLWKTGTEEGESHAIQCYQHVLKLDPRSADAYAGLAYCYLATDPSKARDPAIKAVDLDESLPEGHLALANLAAFYPRDLQRAEREFKRALELNPSHAQAHVFYADLLVAAGQKDRAINEARTARQLDPFSATNALVSGRVFFMAGQYDEAIKEEMRVLDLDPNHDQARYWLGYAYEQKRMYKEAIAQYEKSLPEDNHGLVLAAIGRSLLLGGESKNAEIVRHKMEHLPGGGVWPPYDAALFYAILGNNDRAFESLEKDLKENNGWTIYLKVDPRLSPLRSDPRFADLVKRAGLPQ